MHLLLLKHQGLVFHVKALCFLRKHVFFYDYITKYYNNGGRFQSMLMHASVVI